MNLSSESVSPPEGVRARYTDGAVWRRDRKLLVRARLHTQGCDDPRVWRLQLERDSPQVLRYVTNETVNVMVSECTIWSSQDTIS